jgi:RNA recognition motif-containing protein
MGNRLYVGNLPYNTDESALRSFFGDGQDGIQVTQVKIVTDRETERPRGFAFVELSNPDHARTAIESLNGRSLGGRTIVVNEAREPARGGGGGGGGGGGRRDRGPGRGRGGGGGGHMDD